MTFDTEKLIGALTRAGANALPKIITGNLAGAGLGAVIDIAREMGVQDASGLADAINADPDKARDVIARVEEARKSELDLALAQVALNAKQAESPSMFIAGARPFAMWTCVAVLAYGGILRDVVAWLAVMGGLAAPPAVHPEVFNAAMILLAGLCGIRGFEAWKGVARENLVLPRANGGGR